MYAAVRHTAGQTRVTHYTFQPQKSSDADGAPAKRLPQQRLRAPRGFLVLVYNQLNIRNEGGNQSGAEGGE